MSLDWVRLLPAVIFAALLIIAAGFDIWKRRIPNWTVLTLIAVYAFGAVIHATPQSWPNSLAAFAVALVGTGALYLVGVLGAGDSKLFAATALFTGFGNLLLLTAATTLAGGVLAIGYLLVRPRRALRGLTKRGRDEGGSGVPYGVAIAIGGLVTAVMTRFLWPHQHFTHFDPGAL